MTDKKIIYIKEKIERYSNSNKVQYIIKDLKESLNFDVSNSSTNIFLNIGKVNNIRRINKFHEFANLKLKSNDLYISCAETLEIRRNRVWRAAPYGFRNLIRIFDFLKKRVIPKLPIFKKIYFAITKGKNRVISKAEILGRLISCGFEIIEYFEYGGLLYVISKKVNTPFFKKNVSYGPLFKMDRVGYNMKIIGVYKLRTMYPFSEFLQDFIIKENKLAKSGKIYNDYRITNWGKFCRKFWIDELPMFINFFRNELNIVGVRPLSIGYFKRYPKDLQDLRIKVKPGLVPPYYADLPKNFSEIIESERIYILKKIKNPLITDIIYFLKAFINIVFRGSRSN